MVCAEFGGCSLKARKSYSQRGLRYIYRWYCIVLPNKSVQDCCLTLMIYVKIPKRGEVLSLHLKIRTIMLFSYIWYVVLNLLMEAQRPAEFSSNLP